MKTNWNWEGTGWYAGRQEGAYDCERIEMYFVGSDADERPNTYEMRLGTPQWVEEKPEEDEETFVYE